ncbi:MAG: hypothetical protein PHC83_07160 [Bacteroidales bacterium]|nr:hypothetical protein [Bacteroidales bacterium]MDD4210413.1 hypothetical protein [Bacteroidales bacterium]
MQELKILSLELESKTLQLIEKHKELRIKNKEYKRKNKELRQTIEKLEIKIKEQAEQIVKLKISGMCNDKSPNTDVKLKINEMVREIDKCICLLNE